MKNRLRNLERITTIFPLLAGLMLLVGCEPVVSVHPLHSPDTVVFEPGLLGCWAEEGASECMVRFIRRDDDGYDVLMKEDDGSESAFLAHGVRLGEQLFLDLQPARTGDARTVHAFHFASMHTFYRIALEEGVLHIAYLDDEWLDPALVDGVVKLGHRRSEDPHEHNIVLTEPTAGLQRFVQEYAQDDEAFPALEPLHRIEGSGTPAE